MKTDSEIQRDVIDELKWEPSIGSAEIGVAVKNGVVTLSGTLNSYYKKIAAERAAKKIAGVKAVAEDIVVNLGNGLVRNDSEIAQAILTVLKWHTAVTDEKIKVKVEDGIVTLDGEVDWEFQRRAAVSAIEGLHGVRRIINNVTLKAGVIPGELRKKITAAFHRSATLDSDKIKIDVEGSKVILRGKVRSWAERNDAEQAIWAAKGVNGVENRLEVDSGIFAL
jgi:osmotically-inducible protein OsmY